MMKTKLEINIILKAPNFEVNRAKERFSQRALLRQQKIVTHKSE